MAEKETNRSESTVKYRFPRLGSSHGTKRAALRRNGRARLKWTAGTAGVYLVAAVIGIVFIVPLLWMLSGSLKQTQQMFTYPVKWIPDPFVFRNYLDAWNTIPFGRFLLNTLYFAVLGALGDLVSSSLVGYAFGRLRFPGRNILFIVCLSTVMVPQTAIIIPQFILFKTIHSIDTYIPLILPSWLAYPYWVFLMRQFYMTIPEEFDQSAKIDGCGYFQIYLRILLPLTKPALVTIGIFAVVGDWQKFLEPIVYLNSQIKYTISVGLGLFQGLYTTVSWSLMMAASAIAMFPPVIVFFIAQKYFMQGINLSTGKD
jgi:multiple sugar transport system permease protein